MTLAPLPPILYTKRCKLDRITLHDLDMLRNIVEDIQFRFFLPELYQVVQKVDGMHQFLCSFDAYAQDGEGFLWGIWKQSYLIGFVAIMDISHEPTIFYAIHREYRDKGYTKEAVAEVVAYYRTISKTPLHTEVYSQNHASLAVLSFCGFKIVGNIDDKILLKMQDELTFREKVFNLCKK